MRKDGVILDAKTGAVVRLIKPTSDITFWCYGQSFMRHSGKILSMVKTFSEDEVQLICYDQAENHITTIQSKFA